LEGRTFEKKLLDKDEKRIGPLGGSEIATEAGSAETQRHLKERDRHLCYPTATEKEEKYNFLGKEGIDRMHIYRRVRLEKEGGSPPRSRPLTPLYE
jgi:hypothetical protein